MNLHDKNHICCCCFTPRYCRQRALPARHCKAARATSPLHMAGVEHRILHHIFRPSCKRRGYRRATHCRCRNFHNYYFLFFSPIRIQKYKKDRHSVFSNCAARDNTLGAHKRSDHLCNYCRIYRPGGIHTHNSQNLGATKNRNSDAL